MRPIVLAAAAFATAAQAQPSVPELGPDLERFDYPAPVKWFAPAGSVSDDGGRPLRMAYLDIPAEGRANGRTVALLHGKNFCAATWFETAQALAKAGFRVIVPDQIGFCKSSKPADFQYSFAALGDLTFRLLAAAGVEKVTLVAHSMGGVLGTRMALTQPNRVEQLVLLAPLGLNRPAARYTPLAQLLEGERRTSFDSVKDYQLRAYYHGAWRPAYDRWVSMRAGMYAGAGRERMAIAQARTSDMLATQPVYWEYEQLRVPTVLLIGMLDATGADLSGPPRAVRAAPGSIAANAEMVAARIPGARLVRLEGLGHSPQVEDPATFQKALLGVLERR